MAKLTIPDDGSGVAYVSVQVVLPGRGGGVIVAVVEAPLSADIADFGTGIDAMIDWAAVQAKLEAAGNDRRRGRPSAH